MYHIYIGDFYTICEASIYAYTCTIIFMNNVCKCIICTLKGNSTLFIGAQENHEILSNL